MGGSTLTCDCRLATFLQYYSDVLLKFSDFRVLFEELIAAVEASVSLHFDFLLHSRKHEQAHILEFLGILHDHVMLRDSVLSWPRDTELKI